MAGPDLSGIELIPESGTFKALDDYIWARTNLDQLFASVTRCAANEEAAKEIAAAIGASKAGEVCQDDLVRTLMDLYKASARSEQSSG